MVNKTISISQEMNDILKKEDNASNLIEKLLRTHYEINSDKDNLNKSLLQIKEKEYQLQKEKEEIKSRIKIIEQKEIETIEDQKKIKAKHDIKINNAISIARDFYKVQMTIEQAEEFLDGEYSHIKDYLTLKGLIETEEDETDNLEN